MESERNTVVLLNLQGGKALVTTLISMTEHQMGLQSLVLILSMSHGYIVMFCGYLQILQRSMERMMKCIPRGQLSFWLLHPQAVALWSGPSPRPGPLLSPQLPISQLTRQQGSLPPNHRQGSEACVCVVCVCARVCVCVCVCVCVWPRGGGRGG